MGEKEWRYDGGGFFTLHWEGGTLLKAYATAYHTDGRFIDTRSAVLEKEEKSEGEDGSTLLLTFCDENGLCLQEKLTISRDGVPVASCCLSQKDGDAVETRRLIPLILQAGWEEPLKLWNSLWAKMLLVPYDNTMW